MNEAVVRVERVLPVSPEAVFDAWTNPASLRAWMSPGALSVASAECDARVGGAFRIVMIDEAGAIEHTGRYLELDRPHRLAFTWRSQEPARSTPASPSTSPIPRRAHTW